MLYMYCMDLIHKRPTNTDRRASRYLHIPAAMRALNLAELLFVATWRIVACSSFQAGAVCAGANYTEPARKLLEGKHLILRDAVWSPFAFKAPTKTYGWDGLDVDLITAVAAKLGFTFEIREMIPTPGETWTRMLFEEVNHGDLMLSYWAHTTERLDRVAMLSGHVDMSSVLVGRVRMISSKDLSDGNQLFSFLNPFSYPLWGCLFGMVLASGFIDYFIERGSPTAASLSSSLYEYFAGTLWGGFEYPRSRSSAIYQVTVGFLLLVAISAYTANLAAAMTAQSIPGLSIGTIEEGLVAKTPTCSYPNPMLDEIDSIYPTLEYAMSSSHPELAQRLNGDYVSASGSAAGSGGDDAVCEAAIVPRATFDIWQMDADNCNLRVAAGVLGARAASWATNKLSPCVLYAVEVAISELRNEGKLELIFQKWLRPAACASDSAASLSAAGAGDAQGGRQRRQLQHLHAAPTGALPAAAAAALASTPRHMPRRTGRQLKGGADGSAAAGGAIGLEEELFVNGVQVVQVYDFVGVFIVWGVASLLVIALSWIDHRYRVDHHCMGRCFKRARALVCTTEAHKLARRLSLSRLSHLRSASNASSTSNTAKSPWRKVKHTVASIGVMKELSGVRESQSRRDPFDLSRVNPNDTNGMMFKTLHLFVELRKEMQQLHAEREAQLAQEMGRRFGTTVGASSGSADGRPTADTMTACANEVRREKPKMLSIAAMVQQQESLSGAHVVTPASVTIVAKPDAQSAASSSSGSASGLAEESSRQSRRRVSRRRVSVKQEGSRQRPSMETSDGDLR